MALHQCSHVTVVCAAEQIALPMTGDSSILDFRRPFPDRNGIDDLALRCPLMLECCERRMRRLDRRCSNQLLFQHSARLNEQAAVNGFVGHAQALVVGILGLQPSGNLFRRPVQHQFTRNDLSQLLVDGQQAGLGPQGRLPGLLIRFARSIVRTPAMAGDLPAHRRDRPLQTCGDPTNRRTGSDPSRDVFPLGQRERPQRAPTDCRNDPAMTRQQKDEWTTCLLPNARPISCNDCPAFQRRHISALCAAESPPFPCAINTTFREKIYIRWCCIDRLRPPHKPDKWRSANSQCPVTRR